jgi:Carboxypeptidase regulatory-like domain
MIEKGGEFMRRIGIAALAVAMVAFANIPAMAADVSGAINDSAGKPVSGIKVTAQGKAGSKILGAVSGAKGEYTIAGLAPGAYHFTIDLSGTGYKKGERVEAFVPAKGLTLRWVVSGSAEPIAYAEAGQAPTQVAGIDPFGLSLGDFIATSVLALAGAGGVAVGAYGAAGGFSGGAAPAVVSASK